MNPTELRAEVESGPFAASLAPLVAAGNDQGVADALNDRLYGTLSWGVPWPAVTRWAAGNGVRALLQEGADQVIADPANNPRAVAIKGICLTVLDNIRGSLGTTMLDVHDDSPEHAMLDALVQAGILTAGQKAELIALGTYPASRYEVATGVYGVAVTASDVARAHGRV